jgi:glycosyltransferase involved in cell wall biosynthesis
MYDNITVVIPSFNHAKYIPQLFVKIEKIISYGVHVYIIDDASTDESVDLIKDFCRKNCCEFITVLFKEKNKGLVDSLYTALFNIKTDYFYVISSDDLIVFEGFINAVEFLKKNQTYDFVIFGALNVFSDGSTSPTYGSRHDMFFSLPQEIRREEIFYNHPSPILLQSTIFKTDILKQHNVFDLGLRFDDYPVFIQLLISEVNFCFHPSIVISEYHHHDCNTYSNYRNMYSMFREVYLKLCPNKLYVKSLSQVWFIYFFRILRGFRVKDLAFILYEFRFGFLFHLPCFLKKRLRAKHEL